MKKLITFFFSIIMCNLIIAQVVDSKAKYISQMRNPSKSFSEIKAMADAYFDSLKLVNGGIISSEEKAFKRWEYFWKDRTSYPNCPNGGDFTKVAAYSNLLATNTINICNTSIGTALWSRIGPNSIARAHMGIVTCVAMDPTNNNIIYAGTNFSGLWKGTYDGTNWSWSNSTDVKRIPGMGVSAIAIDPTDHNIIYIATGSNERASMTYGVGVLKSTNGGATWSNTALTGNPQYHINAIKLKPGDPSVLFAVGGKSIYKMTGNGSTLLPPSQIGGNGVSFRDIEFSPNSSHVIYASTDMSGLGNSAQFFVSIDDGLTWNDKTPETGSDRIGIAVTSAQGEMNNVYVLYRLPTIIDVNGDGTYDDSYINIKKSSDNGLTWNNVSSIYNDMDGYSSNLDGIGYWCLEFGISTNLNSTSNLTFYVAGTTVSKSINGGSSFTQISQYTPAMPNATSTHGDIRALRLYSLLPGINTLLIGHDGGIATSNSDPNIISPNEVSATNWNNLNGYGLANNQFYGFDDFQYNNNLVGGTQDNGTLKSSNGIWTQSLGGDGGNTIVDDLNSSIVYGICNSSVRKSNNYGSSFGFLGNPELAPPNWDQWWIGMPLCLDPTNHDNLWFGIDKLWYRTPSMSNWALKWNNPDATITTEISAIAIAPSDPNIVYLGFSFPSSWGTYPDKKFYKSINGGVNFTDITLSITDVLYPGTPICDWASVTSIVIDPNDKNNVFVSFNSYWDDGNLGGAERVMFSENGGLTWDNMSNGLTPFPVNCLTYQEGTDDVIYAGTDVGVYRWNKTLHTWECYNQNLPVCVVSHIEINYCTSKLKISTYGRGIWESDLAPVDQFHITQTQTWPLGSFRSFNNDVFVDGGNILTIKGTVSFAPGKRLIIMPKAKLIVDGGKLTNSCGELWQGVEVVGTGNQPQIINPSTQVSQYQGIVDIINNGIIEYAQDGITTGLTDGNGNFDWGSFGGIIRCNTGKFLNNRRDVQFMSYPNYNNISFFRNCLFETNTQHRLGQLFANHITMWNVKNINILGCDFKYSATDISAGLRGSGIESFDAKFNVTDLCLGNTFPCNNIKRSTFEYLDYGIFANNSNPLRNPTINNAVFTKNNSDGVHLSGIQYPSINNCSFDVASSPLYSGLYLQSCKYYSVQNNSFVGTGNVGTGIFVNNSTTGAHEIYRNSFTGLSSGITPIANNSGEFNTIDGLTMHCNTFNSNNYDISLCGTTGTPNTIAFYQGTNFGIPDAFKLVRNRYSAICGNENQYYVENSTKTVWHASNADANTQPLPHPTCSDNLVNVIPTGIWFNTQHCPDNLGWNLGQISTQINALKITLIALQNNYSNLVDGGNTTQLLTTVNSNISDGNLKNLLISKSPYLSDQVLISYLSKPTSPPNGHIKEVVIANSPVTDAVIAKIDALNLPNGIKQEISNAQIGMSERAKLEAQIVQTEYDRQLVISDKIRYFLNDTIDPFAMDSVIYMLKTEPRPSSSPCGLTQAYIVKGDFVSAQAMVDSLQALGTLDDFCQLQKLILLLNQTVEKCYVMKTNAQIKTQVEDMANDCSKEVCSNAQALLKQVFDYQYQSDRFLPQPQSNRLVNPNQNDEQSYDNKFGLSVFPNPAIDNINFYYKSDKDLIVIIEIRDIIGRLVDKFELNSNSQKDYSTNKLNGSMFFVNVIIEGAITTQQKIVLIK